MTDREAMQQALEALELLSKQPIEMALDYADNAIEVLRERLAQQEQEPDIYPDEAYEMGLERIAYYTIPPQRKPLTDEEITRIGTERQGLHQVARAIEAAHGIKGEA